MKKVFITVALLLSSCTHTDVIYSSKKISKSIDNLQTMDKWLKHDLKDGVQVDHYELLIEQTIYNLERNIKPKRPFKDYSGIINLVQSNIEHISLDVDYGYQCGQISESYYEILHHDLIRLNNSVNMLKK